MLIKFIRSIFAQFTLYGFGGGGGGSQYDAKTGEAAMLNAKTGERAQQFSEQFFDRTLSPMLDQQREAMRINEQRQGQLFDRQIAQSDLARQRYEQYGIPAENRYFQMVDRYNEPAEAERMISQNVADVNTAWQAGQAGLMNQFAQRGINPVSPAVMSALANNHIQKATATAAAAQKARQAAKAVGMGLTQDAANFGRGMPSNIAAFSQLAGQSAMQGFGGHGQAISSNIGAAGVPMQGFGQAQQAYQSNASLYGNLASQENQQRSANAAANASGMGQFMGAAMTAAAIY